MAKPNIYDMDFAKRMENLINQYGGSVNSFSQKIGVSPPTLTRWIKGEADPTRTNLIKIAEAANVSLDWLALGIGDKNISNINVKNINLLNEDDDYEEIDDFRSVNVSAGYGNFNEEYQNIDTVKIESTWLQARRLKAADCAMFTVDGDSMDPTLRDGEEIIVDRSKNELREGKIFVLNHQGTMWVKKVRFTYDSIELISDNNFYNPIKLTTEEADSLIVIGQVVRGYRDF